MSVMCFYSLILRFSLGRIHYVKYINWGFKGLFIGLAYSFYYTAQKVDVWEVRKDMGLVEID